jgi:hypothetical protein
MLSTPNVYFSGKSLMNDGVPIPLRRRLITPAKAKSKRLRQLMEKYTLRSPEVADAAEVHPVTVRKWKSTGALPIETLEYLEYFFTERAARGGDRKRGRGSAV